MKTFKIYLAGGMGNLSWEQQTEWRDTVISLFNSKPIDFKYILDIINPPQYYNLKTTKYDSELEVKKFDLRHVKSSDLIIVNFNDPNSLGTAQELAVAYDRDIPIIGINEHDNFIHPWLVDDCDKLFKSIFECVDYVVEFYLT